MSRIQLHRPKLFVYSALHFSPTVLADAEQVQSRVLEDLSNSGLNLNSFRDATVVLDFRCEGHDNVLVSSLIEFLRAAGTQQVAAIFNAQVDVTALDYPAVSMTSNMIDHGSWFTDLQQLPLVWESDCDFLCLMRRPSVSRAQLGSRLLQEVTSIRMSFGSMCQHFELKDYGPYFPDLELPILLDGRIENDSPLHRDVTNLRFRTCAVNIIAESSAQNENNIWNTVFVTEKTYKAFGMLQIPVWWAVPGVVACVRQQGYDVFDDIIDHGYDNEQDHNRRLGLVIDQVKRLQSFKPQQLRQSLKPRLAANWQKLDLAVQTRTKGIQSILKKLNLDTQV